MRFRFEMKKIIAIMLCTTIITSTSANVFATQLLSENYNEEIITSELNTTGNVYLFDNNFLG